MRVQNMLIPVAENKKDAKANKKSKQDGNKFSTLIPLDKGKKVHEKDKKSRTAKTKEVLSEKKGAKDKNERKHSLFQLELLVTSPDLTNKHKKIQKKDDRKYHQSLKSTKNSSHGRNHKSVSSLFEEKNLKTVSKRKDDKNEKSKNVESTKFTSHINDSKSSGPKEFEVETKNAVKNHHDISSLNNEGEKDFQAKNDKHFGNANEKAFVFSNDKVKSKKSDLSPRENSKAKALHVKNTKSVDVEEMKNIQFNDKDTGNDVDVEKKNDLPSNTKKTFQKKAHKSNDPVRNYNVKNKIPDHSEKFKKSFSIPQKENSLDSQSVSLNDSDIAFKIKNTPVLNDANSVKTRTSKIKESHSKEHFDDVQVKITKGQNVLKHDEIKAVRNVKTFDNSSAKLKKNLNIYKDLPQVNRGMQSQRNFKSQLQDVAEDREQTKMREVSKQISQTVMKALENQKPPLKIELHLNPPQLGKVTINIVEKNGKASLIIDVEKNKTFELMKSAVPIMTNQLSNLNFNLVNIQLNGQQLFEGNQERKQNENRQNGENKEKNGRKFSDEFNDVSEKEV